MRTKLRSCVVLVFGTVFLLVFAGRAAARTVIYWGYNNLTISNPPAGTCPGQASGVACSGWGNWDYSQIDWTSGSGYFFWGFFCQADGYLHGYLTGDGDQKKTYTEFYAALCPGHYNKAGVSYFSGTYDYLQARALVF